VLKTENVIKNAIVILWAISCLPAYAQKSVPSVTSVPISFFELCKSSPREKVFARVGTSWPVENLKIAETFCSDAKGLLKSDIQRIAGTPTAIDLDAETNTRKMGEQEDWLYVVGKFPVLVHVMFEKGVCVSASYSLYYDDTWYAEWRKHELSRFCLNKSVKEIVQGEGRPRETKSFQPKGNCKLSYMINRKTTDVWVNQDNCFSVEHNNWVLCGGTNAFRDGYARSRDTTQDVRFQGEALFKRP